MRTPAIARLAPVTLLLVTGGLTSGGMVGPQSYGLSDVQAPISNSAHPAMVLGQDSKSPASPTSSSAATDRSGREEAQESGASKEPAGSISPAAVTLKAGDAAPAIAVDAWVKGEPVTSFEKGRVYVVEFWATWCEGSRQSIPALTKAQQLHKDLTVIAIAPAERTLSDGTDPRLSNLRKFVREQGDAIGYRIAFEQDREMVRRWMTPAGQTNIPAAFIIDREGKIAWIGHPMGMDGALAEAMTPVGKAAKPSSKKGSAKNASHDKSKSKKK